MSDEFKFGAWYPIESAPKITDEYVLLSNGKSSFPGWYHRRDWPNWPERLCWEWPDDGIERGDPTSWMPFPPPPVTPSE